MGERVSDRQELGREGSFAEEPLARVPGLAEAQNRAARRSPRAAERRVPGEDEYEKAWGWGDRGTFRHFGTGPEDSFAWKHLCHLQRSLAKRCFTIILCLLLGNTC